LRGIPDTMLIYFENFLWYPYVNLVALLQPQFLLEVSLEISEFEVTGAADEARCLVLVVTSMNGLEELVP